MSDLDDLRNATRSFAAAREWGVFHTPKNLAMAVASEAGELVGEFRWLTPDESTASRLSPTQRRAIEFEMADVLIFLLRLADELAVNEARFPPTC